MAYDEGTVRAVWDKGEVTANADPEVWRKDACGAWIRRDFYGDRDSQFGWEIDSVVPKSDGGDDDLLNLRPLHWRNREGRRAGRLACSVTARGWLNV